MIAPVAGHIHSATPDSRSIVHLWVRQAACILLILLVIFVDLLSPLLCNFVFNSCMKGGLLNLVCLSCFNCCLCSCNVRLSQFVQGLIKLDVLHVAPGRFICRICRYVTYVTYVPSPAPPGPGCSGPTRSTGGDQRHQRCSASDSTKHRSVDVGRKIDVWS